MHSITLSDGTVLSNLELSGSTYISSDHLTAADFAGKLSTVTFSDGVENEILTDCKLYLCRKVDNKTWIVIGEKTPAEKQADLNTEIELALTELYELIIGG